LKINKLRIFSKNLETSDFQYVGRRDVKGNFWADLHNVEKNLLRNRAVYPTLGAYLELIYHDYVLYFAKGIRLIT
jgi:hypothetical protein